MKVLLGITGSVAAVLAEKMVNSLLDKNYRVQIVATEASLYFFNHELLPVPVWLEKDEWPEPGFDKNAPIGHIELREWADLLLIAPLTANTLAKMANGICDNFLTSIVRAWDREKPIVIAPAVTIRATASSHESGLVPCVSATQAPLRAASTSTVGNKWIPNKSERNHSEGAFSFMMT